MLFISTPPLGNNNGAMFDVQCTLYSLQCTQYPYKLYYQWCKLYTVKFINMYSVLIGTVGAVGTLCWWQQLISSWTIPGMQASQVDTPQGVIAFSGRLSYFLLIRSSPKGKPLLQCPLLCQHCHCHHSLRLGMCCILTFLQGWE